MINTLDAELKLASEEYALSMMAMIVNRIQQQGLPGRKYSQNPLPEFYFEGRELNAGGRALIEKKERRKRRSALKEAGIKVRKNEKIDSGHDGISYEEWRIANGLQVGHVDLTYSGRMFQNLGIVGTKKVGDFFVAVIGGSNPEVIAKLEWNTIRFGKWFSPTQEEKDVLNLQFNERIDSFLNRLAA